MLLSEAGVARSAQLLRRLRDPDSAELVETVARGQAIGSGGPTRQAVHARLQRLHSTVTASALLLATREQGFQEFLLSADFAQLRPMSAGTHLKLRHLLRQLPVEPDGALRLFERCFAELLKLGGRFSTLDTDAALRLNGVIVGTIGDSTASMAVSGVQLCRLTAPYKASSGDLYFETRLKIATAATVALYAMVGGIIGALLAAVPGMIDLLSLPPGIRRIGIAHMAINLTVVGMYVANAWIRGTQEAGAAASTPITLSVIAILLLLVSGWLGGKMVYERRVGVTEGEAAEDTAATAKSRRMPPAHA